jgi:glycosyltransferase involved in cell wall biosynthesis
MINKSQNNRTDDPLQKDVQPRLRIGIYFNARPEQGGLYQYALTLIDCLAHYTPDFDYILYHANLDEPALQVASPNWRLIQLPSRAVSARMGIEYLLMTLARLGIQIPFHIIPEFGAIKRQPPDVMIYVKPTLHVFQWRYPSIFPIHDLQHRLQPGFPEVSANGEVKRREYMYTRSIPKAGAILTDSLVGKEDVVALYDADGTRIFPLPYIAPTFRKEFTSRDYIVSIRNKYILPEKYFFYPAAFWEHKNHMRLVRALHGLIKKHDTRIHLVLAGSKRHEYQNIARLVSALDLQESVFFIGYVPDDDLAALYNQALALVMPTFFGPTNIPILEAWVAGCPVITSDLRGIREQVGDAGLLVDPREEMKIADAMWHIYQSEELRLDLIQRGRARASAWTPPQFAARLAEVIRFASRPTGT